MGCIMKRIAKIIGIIFVLFIIIGLVFFCIDYTRVKQGEKPIFCIANPAGAYLDGGTVEYFGLGYKVIDFHQLSGYDKIKIGTWLMQYEDFAEEYENYVEPLEAVMRAVVVRADNGLMVMGIEENHTGLYSVGYKNPENLEFKPEQEILIYFDGGILESYPAQISHVTRIEVVKEKSDVAIPEEEWKFCYNSREKVSVVISKLTNTGIALEITDDNEKPYSYSNEYTLYQKVKNEDYTGMNYEIKEATGNTTSAYTRNRQ